MTKQKTGKLKYRSPEELRADHPDIDFDLMITIDNFGDLIAAIDYYDIYPKERCQLLRKANRCNRPHWHGWLAVTKSGSKGLIGRNCAQDHCDSDSFAYEIQLKANRMTLLIQIEETQNSLKMARETWTFNAIQSLRRDMENLHEKIKKLRDCLPKETRMDIYNRIKSDQRIVGIEIEIPEKDDDGKTIHKWHPRRCGSISGLRAIDLFPSPTDFEIVNSAIESLGLPVESSNELDELKSAIEPLNCLDPLPDKILAAEHQLELFTDPSNLELISILVRDRAAKLEYAKLIHAYFGAEYLQVNTHHQFLKKVDTEIRRANDGHDWR